VCHAVDFPTPLQTYVNTPDPTYSYSLATTIKGAATTTYILDLVSQTWLNDQNVRPSVWKHWLEVCVPDIFSGTRQSGIYIDGGGNTPNPPTYQDLNTAILAASTNSVVSRLPQIPNEPTYFASEGFNVRRTEDAIIAYTWEHFLQDPTHNASWLVRLPMVKAVVRAMDAIQDFFAENWDY
jgi:PhoPQ-activated pathogenicity-related protein